MWKAIGLQCAALVIGVLVALVTSGSGSAWFFFLGALCAVVPNALFALRLSLHRGKSAESYPVVFFLGEFLKIGLTLGGLGLIIKAYQGSSTEVAWLALLLGLIIVLKAPLGMWWLERNKVNVAP